MPSKSEEMLEKLYREQGEVFEEVNGLLPRVNEAGFKSYLRYFVRSLKDPKTDEAKEVYDKWVREVSGTQFNRVNVVADDDHTKILFWVPAMNYGPNLFKSNIDQVVIVARERAKSNRNIANEYVKNSLGGKITQGDGPEEDHAQWKMILERYGYMKSSGATKAPVESTSFYKDEEDW